MKRILFLILLALPLPFAYQAWIEFERSRVQQQGELVSVRVLENQALFEQRKENVEVKIKVLMKGRTMQLDVPPRDRHLYPLNVLIDARYSSVSDRLVNTTTEYGYEALKYFLCALGFGALLLWNILRALILPQGLRNRAVRSRGSGP